jgi:O-antigen ligase
MRPSQPTRTEPPIWWSLSATFALALPALLAFNLPPSSTFLNQATALVGWGCWLAVIVAAMPSPALPRSPGMTALQCALALLLLAAMASPLWTGLPWSLALSSAGLIGAAALVAYVAAAAQRGGVAQAAFRAFCVGLVVAGVASSAIGIVQVFAPGWTDGNWIAHPSLPGRAVGNLRQPNHLSSLLLWATIGVLWLSETGAVKRWAGTALAALFVFAIVLSASRTGAVSVGLLAIWGLLDRRLSRHTRVLLLLSPVVYGLFWLGTSAWADHTHQAFLGETRFSGKGDISSSRYGIWSNTIALIRMHPWAGVGFGEFNFAWSLTPFPGRPVAFFDHTHNLPLQFAVELGLPLAALVMALLFWALFVALRSALRARSDADPAQAPLRRAAFMMVFLILVHSLLEYPLWYAYFLLPAAFAFGLCLVPAGRAESVDANDAAGRLQRTRPLLIASMVLIVGGLGSVFDYARVVVIFAPGEGAAPLEQRIADGRRSVFFAHHADYAAATISEHPSEVMASFLRAPHYLLDARLMQAWAKALDEAGDTEHARYIAQRLREFRNEQAEPFFEPCAGKPVAGSAPPFQCMAPSRAFRFEDFW